MQMLRRCCDLGLLQLWLSGARSVAISAAVLSFCACESLRGIGGTPISPASKLHQEHDLGGVVKSVPSCVALGRDSQQREQFQCFALGASNDLVSTSLINGSWSPWRSHGGDLLGNPDCEVGPSQIWCFARDKSGALVVSNGSPGPAGSWSAWQSLGGAIADPHCKSGSCFSLGRNGNVWRLSYSGVPPSSWTAWNDTGFALTAEPTCDHVACAGRGSQGSLVDNRSGVTDRGGQITGTPSCLRQQDHEDDLYWCFARGASPDLLFANRRGSAVWHPLGGPISSQAECIVTEQTHRTVGTLTTIRANQVDCFARGKDERLWQNHVRFDERGDVASVGTWTPVGSMRIQSGPTCIARGVALYSSPSASRFLAHCWAASNSLIYFVANPK
jgi:hypothetical protein